MFESGPAEIPMCELGLSGSHPIPSHPIDKSKCAYFYNRGGFSVMPQVVLKQPWNIFWLRLCDADEWSLNCLSIEVLGQYALDRQKKEDCRHFL